MPVELIFILHLESDWHINAGYGEGARVDAVIQRDRDGVPIIPGSSLKGLFQDAIHDLTTVMHDNENFAVNAVTRIDTIVTQMLGSPGHEGRWSFGAARPIELPALTTLQAESAVDMSQITTGVRINPRLRRAEENKFYRREMGQATTFAFTLVAYEDASDLKGDARWLVAAASYVRRLGGRRRRGAGRCSIRLQNAELHETLLNNFAAVYGGIGDELEVELPESQAPFAAAHEVNNQRFRIWIRARDPIVISERPEAGNIFPGRVDVPGRTLRGALAYRVPSQRRNDDLFRELFVLGGVSFTDLVPVEPVKDADEGYAIVGRTPMGIQQDNEKADKKHPYRSVLMEAPIKSKGYEKPHSLIDDYPPFSGGLAMSTHMHVALDRSTKRAIPSKLFAYEARDSGSYYVGEIRLRNKNWQQFAQLANIPIGQVFELFIGKGRRRGYGHCEVWIEPLDDKAPISTMPLALEKRLGKVSTTGGADEARLVTLTLTSDAVLLDTFGRFVQRFEEKWLAEALDIPESTLKVEGQVVRTKVLQGFDMRAGLPHWRDIALSAGSTVKLRFTNGDVPKEALRHLETTGVGLRRNEGFGGVVVNHPAHSGVVSGFDPLTIPAALLSQDVKYSLRSDFMRRWRQRLAVSLPEKVTLGTVLAKKLIQEGTDYATARSIIDSIGESSEQGNFSGKGNRFGAEVKAKIVVLLDELRRENVSHWRSGMNILAEMLAQRSEQS